MTTQHAITWGVAEAKNRFSELIERARREGPQTITRHGKSAVVVVDAATWQQATARPPGDRFVDFLLASPLSNSGLKIDRPRDSLRTVEL